MNVALSYLSENGKARALTVFNFPEDYYANPTIIVRAFRYIYTYNLKPKKEVDKKIAFLLDKFFKERNSEIVAELGDIMMEFSLEETKTPVLNILRSLERPERPERPERQETKTRRILVNYNTEHIVRKPMKNKTVFEDSQNVHNSELNKSVLKAVETLYFKYKNNIPKTLSDKEFYLKSEILENIKKYLNQKYIEENIIIEETLDYIQKSTAVFGKDSVSMTDFFISLWFWISEKEETVKNAIEKRLLEEFKEMSKLCTTGHVSRLVNSIQGFTEDPDLLIKISEKDSLKAVIKNYLTKKLEKCEDEKVLDEMLNGGIKYKKFIFNSVSEKLLEWCDKYGSQADEDILDEIKRNVNSFSNCDIFE